MTLASSIAQEVTIRVGPFAELPALITSLGYDPQPLFHHVGFQLREFRDTEHRLPFMQTAELIDHCVKVTGASHLGLLLGQQASVSHLGLAGFLAQTAPTTEEALKSVIDNLDLHEKGGIANLEPGPDYCTFSYSLVMHDVPAAEQIYDLAAVMIFRILQGVCGETWQAESVSLARRQPKNPTPYYKYFDTQIYFNSSHSAVTFSSRWMKETPRGHNPLLYRHLSEEAQLLHESQNTDLVETLPNLLNRALLTGQFSSREVASRLGIHERTLHRRLKDANTSFRQELDFARCSLSERLLANTNLPICDIAASLGYSDSSGFIRAFHRWNETSPSVWRRQHQISDPGQLAG